MPYRGRDTYYLELFMAAMSLSMAVMCLFYAGRFATLVFLNHSNMRVPVWLWAMLWITSSAMMRALRVAFYFRCPARYPRCSSRSTR
jgi:hypothetical protein